MAEVAEVAKVAETAKRRRMETGLFALGLRSICFAELRAGGCGCAHGRMASPAAEPVQALTLPSLETSGDLRLSDLNAEAEAGKLGSWEAGKLRSWEGSSRARQEPKFRSTHMGRSPDFHSHAAYL